MSSKAPVVAIHVDKLPDVEVVYGEPKSEAKNEKIPLFGPGMTKLLVMIPESFTNNGVMFIPNSKSAMMGATATEAQRKAWETFEQKIIKHLVDNRDTLFSNDDDGVVGKMKQQSKFYKDVQRVFEERWKPFIKKGAVRKDGKGDVGSDGKARYADQYTINIPLDSTGLEPDRTKITIENAEADEVRFKDTYTPTGFAEKKDVKTPKFHSLEKKRFKAIYLHIEAVVFPKDGKPPSLRVSAPKLVLDAQSKIDNIVDPVSTSDVAALNLTAAPLASASTSSTSASPNVQVSAPAPAASLPSASSSSSSAPNVTAPQSLMLPVGGKQSSVSDSVLADKPGKKTA